MKHNQPAMTRPSAMERLRQRRLSRREALSLLAQASLAAGGAMILPPSALVGLAQDAATPAAPATPALGEQPDGTVTWRVQAGYMEMEEMIETMAFFPKEITINAGDRIFFDVMGLHTVTFPGAMDAPTLFVPESEVMATPAAAGDAGRWVANPMAAFPSGPPVHDGTSYLNSGLPDPTLPPFVVQFMAPGTFDYLCLVHAGMKASVVVQEQGADRPQDQAAVDKQAAAEMEALVERGRALKAEYGATPQATPAAGGAVRDVAVGAGAEGVQVLAFMPDRLEISAGDTVRWTNHGVTEPHTVTFLGGSEPPELLMVEPQPAGPPMLVLNPEAVNPAGGPSYDGTSYANSGWLQEKAAEFPEGTTFPTSWELTFDQPGEYPYYCLLHGGPSPDGGSKFVGMVGTIVVS